ncbi:MAG: PAS domain S-box protein [Deltaproteobacteria bacterium]|nr:PAS domain S-box protein [Deltaproteobacteria bacterium]
MKTQTRITLLLVVITLLFMAGFVMLGQHEARRELLLIRSKIYEKNTLFDRVLRLEQASLEMFAYDFSTRDELVAAVTGSGRVQPSFMSAFMPSFNVSGLWLYDASFRPVYSSHPPEIQAFEAIAAEGDMFPRLFAMSYFCNFFVSTPQGLLEVRSAPVQPASDIERSTRPLGYLFVGRLWNQAFITELSLITESTFDIRPVRGDESLEATYEEKSGIIGFYRIVYGWDKRPVAQIRVRSEASITRELQSTSRNQLLLLIAFVSAVIFLLSVLLILWVNLPLRRISASLHLQDPSLIGGLVSSTTEFGNLARLVRNFFLQQEELTQEVVVRKQAEDALRVALQESQRSGAETAALLQASRAVLSYHGFAEASQSILDICMQLAGAASGFIARIVSGPDGEKFLQYGAVRLPEGFSSSGGMSLAGLYLESFKERAPRFRNETLHLPGGPAGGHPNVDSALCSPLIIGGEVLALLALANKPGGFTDNDLRMASAFSELASVALLNSRMLESLESSEERFRSVVQTASDAIISVDAQDHIVFWNRAAEHIFGYTAEEVIGRDAAMLLPESVRPLYLQMADQIMPKSFDGMQSEMLGLRKDGSEFHMELSRSSWRSRNGVFFTAIVRDISGRIEMERLLRLQEKMASLGRVTAGIAHEIRNPLTGINSYMYSLKNGIEAGIADGPERSMLLSIADEIEAASNKIEGVIRRVMDFAKPGMPRLSLIHINQPIEEALKLSAATLRKSGITVEQELADGLPPCRADLQMIEQVMLNLITNAVQAMQGMSGEKHLEMRSFAGDGHIVATVGDSGPGIPQQERAKIFDPFYTTKSDGSGIGLSLCQRIINDHRGTLSIGVSRWSGAEFRIELPAADPKKQNLKFTT